MKELRFFVVTPSGPSCHLKCQCHEFFGSFWDDQCRWGTCMYVNVMCAHVYIYIYTMCVCACLFFFVQVLRFQLAHFEIQLRPWSKQSMFPWTALALHMHPKNYHGPWTRGFKAWYPSWTWHNLQSTIFLSECFLRLPSPKTNSRKWLYDIHRKPCLALLYKATYPLLI